MSSSRLAVFGMSPLPFENALDNSGPGSRTWQFASSLAADGHEVCLITRCSPQSSSRPAASYPEGIPGLAEYHYLTSRQFEDPATIRSLIGYFQPTALVAATAYPSWVASRLELDLPLWADLFGDVMAEGQALAHATGGTESLLDYWWMLLPVLGRADIYSAVSEPQRHSLIGQLGLRGRLNHATVGHEFVHVIPCGIDSSLRPRGPAAKDPGRDQHKIIVISTGGFNTWVDIETLVQGLELAMDHNPAIEFVSTGGAIPGHDATGYRRFCDLVSRSDFRDRFELRGWVSKEEVDQLESTADLGVIAERPLYERLLGSHNRSLGWMAKGLPVVCARISELSHWIADQGAGLTYEPGDAQGLADAISRLAEDPSFRAQAGIRGRAGAERDFSYQTTTEPLRIWARSPLRAPDRGQLPVKDGQDALSWILHRQHASAREDTYQHPPPAPEPGESEAVSSPGSGEESKADKTLPIQPRRGDQLARHLTSAYLAATSLWRQALAWPRRLWLKPPARAQISGGPGQRPKILVVSPFAVFPPIHGAGVRLWNLLKHLHQDCDLYLFAFSSLEDDPAQRQALSSYCRKVYFHRRDPVPPADPWDLMPRGAQFFRFQRVRERLRDIVETEGIQIVQLELAEMGQYADCCGNARVILSEVDINFVTAQRRRSQGFHLKYTTDENLWADPAAWRRLFRYEVDVCNRADQVHVMSEQDGRFLAPFIKGGWRRIRVIANGVDTRELYPPEKPVEEDRVLFLGSFGHTPNLDACELLLEEIWPRVRDNAPQARLSIVGAHPPPWIRQQHGKDGIQVVGTVDDVSASYRSHRVLVAPLRAGSGTRLKILEAMASGLPVVSTTLGAEGLDARANHNLLVEDDPEAFANAVIRILREPRLAEDLASAGRRLAVEQFDWSRSAQHLLSAYQELCPTESKKGPQHAASAKSPRSPAIHTGSPQVSIVIPTLRGGSRLLECLEAIQDQYLDVGYEVVLVDSGSPEDELQQLSRFPVRLISIPKAEFNHGLTRDLGATHALGSVLVFLNQDAVPVNHLWLHRLTEPLLRPGVFAAVQGGIREVPRSESRFYWDSCGGRFYFTSESRDWIAAHGGIGFSTVNAALRRSAWIEHPFGWVPIMEDKKWQRQARDAGLEITSRPDAAVYHTHNYNLRSLVARCRAEGRGWRYLGEEYGLKDALSDATQIGPYRDLAAGLVRLRIRTPAELLFPWIRPMALYWGNRGRA